MSVKRLGWTIAALGLAAVTASAGARIFGTEPVAISSGNTAPSGGAAISGDNRSVRFVAFHSSGAVFVYSRASGALRRASVSTSGKSANGASSNPALDGSVQRAPRCVAFQSQATNLAAGDRDRNWDIFVRDLKTRSTRLVSKDIGPSAVDPAISGDCRQVAFTAAGRVYVANGLHPGHSRFLARGTNPDISLDGSAITWERGHGVWLRRAGHKTRVAAIGGNPHVSDAGASRRWGVVFDTPARLKRGDSGTGSDVYLRTFTASGGARSTRLISARGGRSLGGNSHNGGLTAYAPVRGIVIFATSSGGSSTLWYSNLHTGNIDDLAHGSANSIYDIATSARGNYAVFSSTDSFRRDTNGSTQDVYLKFLGGQ